MTNPGLLRIALRIGAALVTISMVGCQLIIGLDEYYLAPQCPPNAALCKICNTPADCNPPDQCHTWSCVQHLCEPIDAKAGSPCAGGVCSDLSPSTCVACNGDTDCPSGGYCLQKQCFRCDDGIQNGDEVGVDCSIPGGHCLACQGVFCSQDAECKSGFCSDSICCSGRCDDLCAACNLEGRFGDCSSIPVGMADPNSGCQSGGYVCNGGGGCGKANGASCVSAVECASLKCENGTCVPGP